MAVDDAVAGFAEGNGELRRGLGGETEAREVDLRVEEAGYESTWCVRREKDAWVGVW